MKTLPFLLFGFSAAALYAAFFTSTLTAGTPATVTDQKCQMMEASGCPMMAKTCPMTKTETVMAPSCPMNTTGTTTMTHSGT